jgi:anti-sigma factor RsiW
MSDMACAELVETITAYLEGTLPEADRRRFDAHLAQCTLCTRYLAQMRATIARLGTLDDTNLTTRAREGLLAAFREWHA